MITRKSLADEIDLLDADIKVLNDSKRDCFDAYRDQLIGAGMAKPNIKVELEAVKAAIKRRRAALKDEVALEEKDALTEEIFEEITRRSVRGAHAREIIEEFDPISGEFLEDGEAAGNASDLSTKPPEAADEMQHPGSHYVGNPEPALVVANRPIGDDGMVRMARTEAAAVTPGETATNSEMDRATEGSLETGSEAAEKGRKAIPAGPEGVDLNHAGAGGSPATSCEYCDGTGDVHRIDGEWLGYCHCEDGHHLKASSANPIAPASHGEAESPSVESVSPQAEATTGSSDANTGGDHEEVAQPQYAATHQAGSPFSTSRPAAIPGKLYHEKTPFHPVKRPSYAACFPELSGKAFEDLKADINRNGVIEPIVRSFDTILDGFARYEIARSLGIEYPVLEYTGADPLLDVIKLQRSSRDWTPAQEAKIAKALAAELPGRAAEIWAAFHLAASDEEVIAA